MSEFAPLHSRLHTVFDGGRLGETEEARLLVVMIKINFQNSDCVVIHFAGFQLIRYQARLNYGQVVIIAMDKNA